MAEPGKVVNGRGRVQRLPNVDFVGINGNGLTAATAYRAVPNGQTTRVRSNRTERETLDQIERIYRNYGGDYRAYRAYGRTVNAMLNRNRWGNL